MAELRKYDAATTIYFPLIDFGATDFETTPVAHAAGDTKYNIDGAGPINTAAAFVHEGAGIYSLAIAAAELQGAHTVITIVDQTGPKAWEDQAVLIDTYGAAPAAHALDLDTAWSAVGIASVSGAVGNVTGAVGSVTGAVGSVGAGGILAATFGAGAIDAAAIANNAIDTATFAAGCTIPVVTLVTTTTTATNVTNMVTADMIQISGDAAAANNAESAFDGTGYAFANCVIPAVTLVTTTTDVTNMVTADAIQISGDAGAANNLELAFDGTGYAFTNCVMPTTTTVTNMVTADMIQISGDAGAADNAQLAFDGTGYGFANCVIPTVTTTTTATNVTTISAGGIVAASFAANAITAAVIADNAIDTATFAAGCTIPVVTLVTTTTTATNVTNVSAGGIVTASFAAGTTLPVVTLVTTTTDVTNPVTVGALNAAALDDFFSVDSGNTYAGSVAGSVVQEIADNATLTLAPADLNAIADAVWDEMIAGHLVAGSTGAVLNSLVPGAAVNIDLDFETITIT